MGRCTSAVTGGDDEEAHGLPRVKPFRETYEKEIVMYAYFKRLDYFTTECLYAPFAARGHTRRGCRLGDSDAVRGRGWARTY